MIGQIKVHLSDSPIKTEPRSQLPIIADREMSAPDSREDDAALEPTEPPAVDTSHTEQAEEQLEVVNMNSGYQSDERDQRSSVGLEESGQSFRDKEDIAHSCHLIEDEVDEDPSFGHNELSEDFLECSHVFHGQQSDRKQLPSHYEQESIPALEETALFSTRSKSFEIHVNKFDYTGEGNFEYEIPSRYYDKYYDDISQESAEKFVEDECVLTIANKYALFLPHRLY
jgi:hypothetical protein